MRRIIAFTGLPRSGKDTAASLFYFYRTVAFADPLKEAASILLDRDISEVRGEGGYDREAVMEEWGFSMRWFLQIFGTECLRQQVRDDFWIKRMERTLEGVSHAVITDCRFPNEVDLVRSMGGKVVRIERPGCVDNGHISNRPMPYDIVVHNDGTLAEFEEKIRCLADTIWNTKKPTKSSPRSSKSGKSATKRAISLRRQGKSTRATGSTSTIRDRSLQAAGTSPRIGGSGRATRTGRKGT